MYEYFVAYRWYGKWEGSIEGYGNFTVTLDERISKAEDIDIFREKIKKEFPDFRTIIIIFYSEFVKQPK